MQLSEFMKAVHTVVTEQQHIDNLLSTHQPKSNQTNFCLDFQRKELGL